MYLKSSVAISKNPSGLPPPSTNHRTPQIKYLMIKKNINRALLKLGYKISRIQKQKPSGLERFFTTWSRCCSQPALIIDIGANHGGWTRTALRFFPNSEIIMIEPQERLKVFSEDILKNKNIFWKTAGISNEIGILKLSLPPRDDSASFAITEKEATAAGYPRIDVPVTTINALVNEINRIPTMIKIDAEGFDLKALHGASTVLGKTEVILIECAVVPKMENELEAILPLLWSHGYRIIDITDLNISQASGVLWLAELVFVHSSSPIWQKINTY